MATITYSFSNIVPEFVVNDTTTNHQQLPDVVALSSNGDLFFTSIPTARATRHSRT